MGKRVFMFPGQGSQYIGMGKEFYDTMPNAKAVIDLASEQTGLDIPALCFEENDKLNITEYTQICMLAVEAAIYQAIIDKGITPDVTAGLSLRGIWCSYRIRSHDYGRCIRSCQKKRNLHAGGSSYRRSHDSGFRT